MKYALTEARKTVLLNFWINFFAMPITAPSITYFAQKEMWLHLLYPIALFVVLLYNQCYFAKRAQHLSQRIRQLDSEKTL